MFRCGSRTLLRCKVLGGLTLHHGRAEAAPYKPQVRETSRQFIGAEAAPYKPALVRETHPA